MGNGNFYGTSVSTGSTSLDEIEFGTKNNGGWAVYADGERLTPNCFSSKKIAHEFINAYRQARGNLTSSEFFERRALKDDWGW